jgi:uncharacterized protein (TIGR00255 family)
MIKSMTGYGRAEAIVGGKRIVMEIKSLNHRFLEVSLRLPGALSSLELELKKKINAKFSRGKIEVGVRMDSSVSPERGAGLDLNLPLLRNYHSLLSRMKEELDLPDEISLSVMSSFRDIFISQDDDDLEAVWQKLEVLLEEAVAMLMVMRAKEGEALVRDLRSRINVVEQTVEIIQNRVPQVLNAYQKRLTERVKELVGDMEIDAARLMQEVAIMAEKSDITEEIVRFRSHIAQFVEMLKGDEAVGRKIDFLIQEMGREVNTIGSKSNDAEISVGVIEIKSELARIREQVQNLE